MPTPSRMVVKRAIFALWGMATLVLVFCVALLAVELARRGSTPSSSSNGADATATRVETESAAGIAAGDVTLYFASPDGRLLVKEKRRLDLTRHTVDNCRLAAEELIRGSRSGLQPVMPDSTKVRGLYLLQGGVLVVDLSRELELNLPRSASAEALMAYALVNTLTQPELRGRGANEPAVRRVQFLFEGSLQDAFPAHVDASEPIAPDAEWVLPDRSGDV